MAVRVLGDKAMNIVISGLPVVNAAVRKEAKAIAARAEGRLATHRKTGHAKITVTHGDTDSFVNLEDEAALSIEFGHFHDNGEINAVITYVPGLYIITGAAGLI